MPVVARRLRCALVLVGLASLGGCGSTTSRDGSSTVAQSTNIAVDAASTRCTAAATDLGYPDQVFDFVTPRAYLTLPPSPSSTGIECGTAGLTIFVPDEGDPVVIPQEKLPADAENPIGS